MQITPDQKAFMLSLIEVWYPNWQGITDPRFEKNESGYKRKAAAKAKEELSKEYLDQALARGAFEEIVLRARRIGERSGMLEVRFPAVGDLGTLYAPTFDPQRYCHALYDLLYGPGRSSERLGRYGKSVEQQGWPSKWPFPTLLLSLLNPAEDIMVKPSRIDWLVRFLKADVVREAAPSAASYASIQQMGQAVATAFAGEGAVDLIDAHSIIWTCAGVVDESIVLDEKKAEFAALYTEFLAGYVQTPAGAAHRDKYASARQEGVANLELVVQTQANGEPITDLVLTKLLPYVDTPQNRQRGAWTHWAPVINGNIKGWYEAKGWVEPSAWPKVTEAILTLVRSAQSDPAALPAALATFATTGTTKGFQAGQITPILNAARPETLHLFNDKPRRVLAYFTKAKKLTTALSEYVEANRAIDKVLRELGSVLAGGDEMTLPPADRFDMFCHWLVAVRKHPLAQARYWRINLTEGEAQEQDWLANDVVSFAAGALGDVTGLSRPAFDLKASAPESGLGKADANMLWKFARYMNRGDRVVATKGAGTVIGIGTVDDPYFFDPSATVGHRVHVIWEDQTTRTLENAPWSQTVEEISADKFSRVLEAPAQTDAIVPPSPQPKPPVPPPSISSPFSRRTFELLAGIRDNPTMLYYDTHKVEFHSALEEPFQRVVRAVAEGLDPRIKQTMETEKRIFSRFRKNDFGLGGAWPHYWSAFYPKGSKRSEDAQLSVFLNADCLEYGFYIGEYASVQRKRFVRNLQQFGGVIAPLMTSRIPSEAVTFGEVRHLPPGAGSPPAAQTTWEDFAADPDKYNCDVGYHLAPNGVLALAEEKLVEAIRKVHEALYPLVLLALLDDPLPAIKEFVGDEEEGKPYQHTTFLATTSLRPEEADELVSLLEDRKQLLLFGPPGTGKTFVARELGKLLTGLADPPRERMQVVQFHPAYGYEDFIEGIRPSSLPSANGGHVIDYPVQPGIFQRFCQQAKTSPGKCVFIIDEVNRGNIARIFGELLYLLEYRDAQVTLPYSGQTFFIPDNVYIVGTMNTADRSIALVDFALRRRFHFYRFGADPDLLRRWLATNPNPGIPYLHALYTALTAGAIDDENLRIGPSHFMRPDLTEEGLRRVWQRSVEPYLAEYYFDDPTRAAQWRWEGEKVTAIRTGPSGGQA